jgi:phage baseplate assembly protein W
MAAVARFIDPVTGDVSLDGRSWRRALTPELAIVVNVLRTTLGTAGRDRTYGVEEVDNETPNAEARWKQAVAVALKRWVDRGTLRELVVEATVEPAPTGTVLRSTVTFRGRDGRRQSIELER